MKNDKGKLRWGIFEIHHNPYIFDINIKWAKGKYQLLYFST